MSIVVKLPIEVVIVAVETRQLWLDKVVAKMQPLVVVVVVVVIYGTGRRLRGVVCPKTCF